MVSREQILDALKDVQDPELHRSIIELDMVREIELIDTSVIVTIALTVSGCPLKDGITRRVTGALTALDGIDAVKVNMTVMTPEDLDRVRRTMQEGGGHSHDHKAQATHPFTAGGKTRIIGITSGKGGVGKSSVTTNLAVALAREGREVCVLDADVYGFSIPTMLGVKSEPDVVHHSLIPPVAHGVRCMSIGFFVEDETPVMWRGPMLHKALEQFLVDVEWGRPDYLIIDMPPGTGDVAMSMANYIPNTEIVVVTTPQPAAQRVAQRSGMMARELNLPVLGVIENMSWFTGNDGERYELFGAGGGQLLADALNSPLLAQIPLVPALRSGGDTGEPVVVAEPTSEVALCFEQLARDIDKAGPRRVYREELKVI